MHLLLYQDLKIILINHNFVLLAIQLLGSPKKFHLNAPSKLPLNRGDIPRTSKTF